MNERIINELVEKAITQNEPDWPQFKKELTGSGALYLHVFAEKFAELLIRECAEIADLADENKCEWIGGNILTHFGVE